MKKSPRRYGNLMKAPAALMKAARRNEGRSMMSTFWALKPFGPSDRAQGIDTCGFAPITRLPLKKTDLLHLHHLPPNKLNMLDYTSITELC